MSELPFPFQHPPTPPQSPLALLNNTTSFNSTYQIAPIPPTHPSPFNSDLPRNDLNPDDSLMMVIFCLFWFFLFRPIQTDLINTCLQLFCQTSFSSGGNTTFESAEGGIDNPMWIGVWAHRSSTPQPIQPSDDSSSSPTAILFQEALNSAQDAAETHVKVLAVDEIPLVIR